MRLMQRFMINWRSPTSASRARFFRSMRMCSFARRINSTSLANLIHAALSPNGSDARALLVSFRATCAVGAAVQFGLVCMRRFLCSLLGSLTRLACRRVEARIVQQL